MTRETDMRQLAPEDLDKEIVVSEAALREPDGRAIRLWERMRIVPEKWSQEQYPGVGLVWVIGILGSRCLYLNSVEGGWGWGEYLRWGQISEYHWEQLEIHQVVFQTLFAIDKGGRPMRRMQPTESERT
ncbi:hypothetical protein ACFL2Q_02625 [Thermodesulfobacteriota bacterium]